MIKFGGKLYHTPLSLELGARDPPSRHKALVQPSSGMNLLIPGGRREEKNGVHLLGWWNKYATEYTSRTFVSTKRELNRPSNARHFLQKEVTSRARYAPQKRVKPDRRKIPSIMA